MVFDGLILRLSGILRGECFNLDNYGKKKPNRHRLTVVCDILACCRMGPLLGTVIVRRCNMNNDTFHLFEKCLVDNGFLSRSCNNGSVFYGITRLGLDFLRKYDELQVLVKGLERGLGVLV